MGTGKAIPPCVRSIVANANAGPENDRSRVLTSKNKTYIMSSYPCQTHGTHCRLYVVVTILAFGAKYCLFPFGRTLSVDRGLTWVEDNLYLIPAATFAAILCLSSSVYVLHFIFQCLRRRRRPNTESPRFSVTLRYFPRVAVIAGFIILERIIYRHAYTFALGLELVLLKVLIHGFSGWVLMVVGIAVYISVILDGPDGRGCCICVAGGGSDCYDDCLVCCCGGIASGICCRDTS